jgi:hypothetical protein
MLLHQKAIAGIAVALCAVGSRVLACSHPPTVAEAVHRPYDGAAEVIVVSVEAASGPKGWRAHGKYQRAIFGHAPAANYNFGDDRGVTGGGSEVVIISSCPEIIPKPQLGERWVIYLRSTGSDYSPAAYFPYAMVSSLDTRIGISEDRGRRSGDH